MLKDIPDRLRRQFGPKPQSAPVVPELRDRVPGLLLNQEYISVKSVAQLEEALRDIELGSDNNLHQVKRLEQVDIPDNDPELPRLIFLYVPKDESLWLCPVISTNLSRLVNGRTNEHGIKSYYYVVTETLPNEQDKSTWAEESTPKLIIEFMAIEKHVGEDDFSEEALSALQKLVQNGVGAVLNRKLGFVFKD